MPEPISTLDDTDLAPAAPQEAPAKPPTAFALTAYDAFLYVAIVFVWSTSWIGIKFQVAASVAPEVSLVWRFALAACGMWVWTLARRERIYFPVRVHLRFALMGVLMFSSNFLLFYLGASALPSGLLSVVFSLASVFNLFLAALFLKARIEPRVLIGGLLGFSGIAAMFWPQIARTQFDTASAIGLGLCVAGTLSFCLGNMLSSTAQRDKLPILPSTAWGMVYGTAFLAVLAAVQGQAFTFAFTLPYVGSLLWLSLMSSVIAFWAYLTLLGRIGAARAGYTSVIFPVFALLISTVFENYQWTAPAYVGLGLAIAGNLFVLSRRPA
jgi:drug/metabolite transporter (DMT)-like permease